MVGLDSAESVCRDVCDGRPTADTITELWSVGADCLYCAVCAANCDCADSRCGAGVCGGLCIWHAARDFLLHHRDFNWLGTGLFVGTPLWDAADLQDGA